MHENIARHSISSCKRVYPSNRLSTFKEKNLFEEEQSLLLKEIICSVVVVVTSTGQEHFYRKIRNKTYLCTGQIAIYIKNSYLKLILLMLTLTPPRTMPTPGVVQ